MFYLVESGSFNNNPGTVNVHENNDAAKNVWTIQADCTVTYQCSTTCYYESAYNCGWWEW